MFRSVFTLFAFIGLSMLLANSAASYAQTGGGNRPATVRHLMASSGGLEITYLPFGARDAAREGWTPSQTTIPGPVQHDWLESVVSELSINSPDTSGIITIDVTNSSQPHLVLEINQHRMQIDLAAIATAGQKATFTDVQNFLRYYTRNVENMKSIEGIQLANEEMDTRLQTASSYVASTVSQIFEDQIVILNQNSKPPTEALFEMHGTFEERLEHWKIQQIVKLAKIDRDLAALDPSLGMNIHVIKKAESITEYVNPSDDYSADFIRSIGGTLANDDLLSITRQLRAKGSDLVLHIALLNTTAVTSVPEQLVEIDLILIAYDDKGVPAATKEFKIRSTSRNEESFYAPNQPWIEEFKTQLEGAIESVGFELAVKKLIELPPGLSRELQGPAKCGELLGG